MVSNLLVFVFNLLLFHCCLGGLFIKVCVVEVGQDVVLVLQVVFQESYFGAANPLKLDGECLVVNSRNQHGNQDGFLGVVLLVHTNLLELYLVLLIVDFDILDAFILQALQDSILDHIGAVC